MLVRRGKDTLPQATRRFAFLRHRERVSSRQDLREAHDSLIVGPRGGNWSFAHSDRRQRTACAGNGQVTRLFRDDLERARA